MLVVIQSVWCLTIRNAVIFTKWPPHKYDFCVHFLHGLFHKNMVVFILALSPRFRFCCWTNFFFLVTVCAQLKTEELVTTRDLALYRKIYIFPLFFSMPIVCSVCSKKYYKEYQNALECTTCGGWVHHGNRLGCSGLTDDEYQEHRVDEHKPFECDHCVRENIAKANNSVFVALPFPVECEDNPFGKPRPEPRPDVSSMTPSQLKRFVDQCEQIENQLKSGDDDSGLASTSVNSKYHNFKTFNSLKPDKSSSFGLFHVNIASLSAHVDDLRAVLGRLKFSFDIIGISEHKISKDSPPSNNIEIAGYNEFEFEPTGTTHGGTGFYIKNGLDYRLEVILH